MQLHISKWGNSLALRLPAKVAKQLHIHDGDSVDFHLDAQGKLILTPTKVFDKAAFLKNLNALSQSQPKTESVINAMRNGERY